MKLSTVSALAAYALALSAAHALTIESSGVAPPADIIGEHQPLQKTWTISSLEELEKLHLLVPGRVFIDVEGAVVAPAATKPAAAAIASATDINESDSASTSGSRDDSDDAVVVGTATGSSSSWSSSASASGASDANDIVFPTPAPTTGRVAAVVNATRAPANTTAAPSTKPANKAPVRVVSDASSSLDGSRADAVRVQNVTTQLRRVLKEEDDDSDDSDDKKQRKKDKKKDKKAKKTKPTDAVVATIVVSGNSSALIDLFAVVPLHERSQNGLKLHLKNEDAAVDGFVLTQIVLANKHAVRHVSTVFADAVVIGDGVLVQDDKDTTVKLATSGAGNVFVASKSPVALDALKLDVAGAGSVQLQVPALTLEDTLSVNVAGSGGVALLAGASLKTAQVKAAVSGSGDLIVQTDELSANDVSAAVYGSGSVSFASAGNVTTEKLTLSGSGNVFAGSIVAERASVSVWGSGDVIVQATEQLKVTTTFSGSVAFVGARPADVKTSKWLFWRSDIVHPAAENTVLPYTVVAAPARYPSYAALVTKQVFYSDEPIVKVDDAAPASYVAVVSTHLSSVAHGPNGFWVFSLVATTLVVVGLAANSFHKRRVRRHYRPLV